MTRRAVGFLIASAALAQNWEAGGLAGGGFYNHPSLTSPLGTAEAGFARGAAFGAFLEQHLYRHVSGEIRYIYQQNDLAVSFGAARAKFRGDSHAIHYDWQFHVAPSDKPVRPFVAAGAGFKRYRGTGAETMMQPLSQFALLTRVTEWKPLVSLGGGLKLRATSRIRLRVELRDYLTPFPKKVIAPAPRTDLHGWLHDVVPSVGVSIRF